MKNTLRDREAVCVLLRTTSAEELKAACELLDKAEISYRATGTKAGFDIMEVGRAGGPADKLLLIAKEDHPRACEVMEQSYASTPLPQGHFLQEATDDEILEILAAPEEWSFFDLAQARKMARARQLSAVDLAEKKVAHVTELREGRPAPKMLMGLGWILSLVGSGIGILLGVGIIISMEQTPHGSFPKYDKASRESAANMIFVSVVMAVVLTMLLLTLNGR
ncbi:hypothetical protein [Prosthecobacter sp.]|uniref:hypothetical protein n=1 Tax=Prosthecobacter sp. TaxID=1965333 RepID=UPI003784DA07